MSTMQSEGFEAFRSIVVPEGKASKAAAALSNRDDDVSSLKSDTGIVKWMMGPVPAFQGTMFVKLLVH